MFGKGIRYTVHQYIENSKVNGLWLLRHNQSLVHLEDTRFRRLVWSAILLFLFILGVSLSIMLWNKFYSLPTLVTIETHVPVTNVAFPGITLCSPLTVLERKLLTIMNEMQPTNYTSFDVTMALRSLEGFTTRHIVNTTRYRIADQILEENNLTVFETIRKIGGSCDDFLQYCYWGSTQFPCYQKNEDLSFTTSVSSLGFCCSFNYYPENKSYVPFSVNSYGASGGLVIVGLDKIMGNQSTGLIMKVHHPLDYAVQSNALITLNPHCETFVAVHPVELSSSKDVLELNMKKRNCQIASDLKLSYYRQAGCTLNCQLQLIYRTCGCYPYHFPAIYKVNGDHDCAAKDIACLLKNYDRFKNIKCNRCLPNCYDVTYTTTKDYTDLLQQNISASVIYSKHNLSEHNFIVRIYMANQVVQSHKKIIVMSVISLLADLGGVFNLCLGISVISVVEFLYFFTFRLYKNYKPMVVIKECFPSRVDFIAEYLASRRQQLEILQERKFKVSFVPNGKDQLKPSECSSTDKSDKLHDQPADILQTPGINSAPTEPKYVKNFNTFIEQTNKHLNQILANNQRIEDVHGIVTQIQKPSKPSNKNIVEEDTQDAHTSSNCVSAREDNIDYRETKPLFKNQMSVTLSKSSISNQTKCVESLGKLPSTGSKFNKEVLSIPQLKYKSPKNLKKNTEQSKNRSDTSRSSTKQVSSRFQKPASDFVPVNKNAYPEKSFRSRLLLGAHSSRSLAAGSVKDGGSLTSTRSEKDPRNKKAHIPVSVINLQL